MSGSLAQVLAQPQPQPVEPPDMTSMYNTQLSPADEAKYQEWGKQQAALRPDGRNPANDAFDYDMRGFWQKGDAFADNGHAGDQFKKPNHPTFSNQSQYHGVDGHQGGVWGGGQDGQPWTFTPSATNLQMNDAGDLQHYFQTQEKGNQLILPNGGNPPMRPLFSDAPVLQQAQPLGGQPGGSSLAAALSHPTGMPMGGGAQMPQIPLASMMLAMQQQQGAPPPPPAALNGAPATPPSLSQIQAQPGQWTQTDGAPPPPSWLQQISPDWLKNLNMPGQANAVNPAGPMAPVNYGYGGGG